MKELFTLIPVAWWTWSLFPEMQLCFTGNVKSFLLSICHSSDTDGDILWSLPSPRQMLGSGFMHTPPKMVDYLTVTEKQEESWLQLRRDYIFHSK